MSKPIIYWFRQDLRTADLPGLQAAAASGQPVVACYLLDDVTPGGRAMGAASRWWLHHSLAALAAELQALGGELILRRGAAASEIPALAQEIDAAAVYCSRAYEPWAAALEETLHQRLEDAGVECKRFGGSLLFTPETISNLAGKPFRVFTPFWKACRRKPEPELPGPVPATLDFAHTRAASLSLEELELLPHQPDWAAHWNTLWQPGSAGAASALRHFLDGPLANYEEARNHPARDGTSKLSPHLHFGELSPRQLWHALRQHCAARPELAQQEDKFLSELGWREFSHHLLHHFPTLGEEPFKPEFSAFPWLGTPQALRAWQLGRTGYPIVDAGMRELWATGYMHNRVRMITASFLTKHLLVPWQAGERWFWDTLVDADMANNASGWQWVAGSGADASPYFRIFNPTLQGQRFDGDGDYVRQWVPELAALPNKYLHEPSSAPASLLTQAGIILGDTYPEPIVDHRDARAAALDAYASLRSG